MGKDILVVLKTLSIVFLRKKVLTIIFIVLAIPSMIITTYNLISNTFTEETTYLYKSIYQDGNVFITPQIYGGNTNCTPLRFFYTKIMLKDMNLTTPIIVLDKETYIKYTRYWPRKNIARNKTILVSIPSIYKDTYGLKLGEELSICNGNNCYKERISLIHKSRGVLDSAIILVTTSGKNNEIPNMGREYCIISTNNYTVEELTRPFTKTLTMIQEETTILLTLAYFPIMLLGLAKIKRYMDKETCILYELGVSEKNLRMSIVFILMVLGILICIYGVSLATLITHLSLWILRLYGIILVSRPLPEPTTISPYIALFMTIYLIAAIIVFGKRNGVET